MNKPKTAIILVNWNGKGDTLECLSTLADLDQKKSEIVVIVVDNASTDGSVAAITKQYPDVIVLAQAQNKGFAGGNNQGMRYALSNGCDFIWLVNNDTTVEKHALTGLIEAYNAGCRGVFGSKIYFSPGHEFHKTRYKKGDQGRVLWYAGGVIDWNNVYASHRGVDQVDTGQFDTRENTDYITGCSFFVHRSVLEKVGLYDERYFAFLEDVDFCLRAKKAGFGLWYVPSSVLWHKNASSTSGPGNPYHEYYLTRNRLLIGLSYAQMRTKFALFREALRFLAFGSPMQQKAVGDAFMGRLGRGNI